MNSHYDEEGVSFQYPENWRLDREESEDGWTVILQSPGTAFLTITLSRSGMDASEIASAALEVLQTEYPALEATPQVETVAGQMAVGHDIEFFSLDLTNTCWTRCFETQAGILLILCQSNDLEMEEYGPVLRAVCASLKVEED
jgi:hypothetical protein